MLSPSRSEVRWPHYLGIFLISLATLLLELAITRALAVANWYHFGFLVISTALLGFGVSGVTLTLWPRLRVEAPLERSLAWLSLAFGVTSVLSFWVMQRIPFDAFNLLADPRQLIYAGLNYIVLAVPFFCSGLAISLLLSRGTRQVNRLYAADLVGAAFGCAAIRLVMPSLGGSGTVVAAAALGVVAALAFLSFRPSWLAAGLAAAALGFTALAKSADRFLPITLHDKHHPLRPAGRTPIYSEWNTFSKIDLYQYPADPERGWPVPGYSLVIDEGAAGTAIPDLSGGVREFLAKEDRYRPAGLAYIGKTKPKVLIIGSGAGREVLEGLRFGASSITAVEINPIINDIVTRRFKERWGGLFEQPEVQVVTEDGRSFVRRSHDKFDAIIAIHTMSDAALSSGAASFGETYILTQEAIQDYWDHLTPTGTLLITRPPHQLPKLFATVRRMFDARGLGSPAGHLFAFRGTAAQFGAFQFTAGFLVQKTPLSSAQVDSMAFRLGVGLDRKWSDRFGPEIFYSPFKTAANEYETTLAGLAGAGSVDSIIAQSEELIEPATDDEPFFNRRTAWSKFGRSVILDVIGGGKSHDVDAEPVAEVTLSVLLAQALLVAAVMIVLPLVRFNRQGLRVPGRWAILTYFSALGIGFILIEIVLLQRFSLFLGQPVYTLSVVLASLLMATGIGSYLASLLPRVSARSLSGILLLVVALILVLRFATGPLLDATLGLSLEWRIVVTVAMITPLGIALGAPFATGLRLIGQEGSPLVSWAWAANGFFTVVGSVVAMMLGMGIGFASVLTLAAVCYLAAFVAIRSLPANAAGVDGSSWLIDWRRPVSKPLPTEALAGPPGPDPRV